LRRLCNIWMVVIFLVWHAVNALGAQVIPPSEGSIASGLAEPPKPAAGIARKPINVWTHEDANSPEFAALRQAVETFNRQQHTYRVEISSSLRRNYKNWMHREAATGTLPCLLDFDGPQLAEFAWPRYLKPIDQFVPRELLNDFLPSIIAQGTYQGRLYSLGQFDSGVGLWGNRRYLRAAGVRIPTLQSPWSLAEFEDALAKLTALKEVDYAINFAFYSRVGEFYSYAYAPIVQSFGGDLIDRRTYRSTKGILNGSQSVAAMKRLQYWIDKGWTQVVFDRPDDFEKGKVALSWTGHWAYQSYHKALGKDLVLMPLPNFGRGIKTGMGSWSWGISNTCHDPAGAWAFLAQLLSAKEIVRMTNINNAIPARWSALMQSPLYGPRGPLKLFVQQLAIGGMPRPVTPAYSTISQAFAEAVSNIIAGGDVQSNLSKAVDIIDRTIAENRGYPYP